MRPPLFFLPLAALLALFVSAAPGEEPPRGPDDSAWRGPCDLLLDAAGANLYLLEEDGRAIRRMKTDGKSPGELLALPVRPTRFVFMPGERQIAVVGGEAEGKALLVQVADETTGEECPMTIRQEFAVGHTPSDAAVRAQEGKTTVYVSNRFDGTISVIDVQSGETRTIENIGREPFAMKITPDGKRLVVAGLTAEKRADVAYTMACVRIVELEPDGEEHETVHNIELLNGVTNLKDIAISPDGVYALITGTIGNYQTVTSQVVGGWIVENVVSVVDAASHQLVDTIYLDDTLRGSPNPWGITFSDDGRFLAVAISGTNEILLMPYDRIQEILNSRPVWNRPGYGAYTYSYKGKGEVRLPIRLRVTLGLSGMRRLIMRGDTVWVNGLFDDAVGRLKLKLSPPYEHYENDDFRIPGAPKPLRPEEDAVSDDPVPPLKFIELEPFSPLKGVDFERSFARIAPKPVLTSARRGELLFHSALPCMEHWQSCITCHPDGRVDGLNWDLLNDGVGNPKNTKSLLLSHETPPSMITGVRADAETAVRAGVIHILFGKLPEEDYSAMDDYLSALRPAESPHRVDGELSESARRGKFLFESSRTNCSTCHPEPLFTDLSMHAVGSQSYNEGYSRFDTPTLIEVWRTAPYMNNGHWLTVRELLREGKHGNQDGLLDRLSEQEFDDLVEYVLSL